ncbi:hypothetical protein [Hydrogenobacter thermophilus]|uniref:hypothetical protein n=1 Tax=Hydrogenobacter thermophilus TaxID=940 RepID=UPI0030F612D7
MRKLVILGQGLFILGLFLPLFTMVGIISISAIDLLQIARISIKLLIILLIIISIAISYLVYSGQIKLHTAILAGVQELIVLSAFIAVYLYFGELERSILQFGKDNPLAGLIASAMASLVKPSLGIGWLFLLAGSGLSFGASLYAVKTQQAQEEDLRQSLKYIANKLGFNSLASVVATIVIIGVFSLMGFSVYKEITKRTAIKEVEQLLLIQETRLNKILADSPDAFVDIEKDTKGEIKHAELEPYVSKLNESYQRAIENLKQAVEHKKEAQTETTFYGFNYEVRLMKGYLEKAVGYTKEYVKLRNLMIDKFHLRANKLPEDLPESMAQNFVIQPASQP